MLVSRRKVHPLQVKQDSKNVLFGSLVHVPFTIHVASCEVAMLPVFINVSVKNVLGKSHITLLSQFYL